MVELVIINISILVYLILGGYIELRVIFVYYLVFSVCEKMIELIILILVNVYKNFSLNKIFHLH